MAGPSRHVARSGPPLPVQPLPGPGLRRAHPGPDEVEGAPDHACGRGAGRDRPGAGWRGQSPAVAAAVHGGERRYHPAPDRPPSTAGIPGPAGGRHRRLGLAARAPLRHHRLRSRTPSRPGSAAASLLRSHQGMARRPSGHHCRQPGPGGPLL